MPDRSSTALTDGVVLLRPPRLDDVPQLYLAVRESIAEIGRWMGWAHEGYAIEETEGWVSSLAEPWEQDKTYEFLITDARESTVLGAGGINNVQRHYRMANLGYWVRTGRTGRGVATRAARLLARFGLEELDLVRVEIVVAVGNVASLRVAKKAGAVREGVLRNRIPVGRGLSDAVMHSFVPEDLGIAAS